MSGKIVRFRSEGDRQGKRNGWAILYFDSRPAGAFGSYRMGFKTRWKANDLHAVSPADRQRMQREWAAARQRREQERHDGHRRVAGEAQAMWANCAAADPQHPYLAKKGMAGEKSTITIRTCPECYHVHRPAPACPQCDHGFVSAVREIEQVEGELAEVDPAVLRAARKIEERNCVTYEDFAELGRQRGYKPGWAQVRWQQRVLRRTNDALRRYA